MEAGNIEDTIRYAPPELKDALFWLAGAETQLNDVLLVRAILIAKQETTAKRWIRVLTSRIGISAAALGTAVSVSTAVLAALGILTAGVGAAIATIAGTVVLTQLTVGAAYEATKSTITYSKVGLWKTEYIEKFKEPAEFTVHLFSLLAADPEVIISVSECEKVLIASLIRKTYANTKQTNAGLDKLYKTSVIPFLAVSIGSKLLVRHMDYRAKKLGSGPHYFLWQGRDATKKISPESFLCDVSNENTTDANISVKVYDTAVEPPGMYRRLLVWSKGALKDVKMYSCNFPQCSILETQIRNEFSNYEGINLENEFEGKCWTIPFGRASNQAELKNILSGKSDHQLMNYPKTISVPLGRYVGHAASIDLNYVRLAFRVIGYNNNGKPLIIGHTAKCIGAESDPLYVDTLAKKGKTVCRPMIPILRTYYKDNDETIEWGGNKASSLIRQYSNTSVQIPDTIDKTTKKLTATTKLVTIAKHIFNIQIVQLAEYLDWSVENVYEAMTNYMRGSPTTIDNITKDGGLATGAFYALLVRMYFVCNVSISNNKPTPNYIPGSAVVFREGLTQEVTGLNAIDHAYFMSMDIQSAVDTIKQENMEKERRSKRFTQNEKRLIDAGEKAAARYNMTYNHEGNTSNVDEHSDLDSIIFNME